MWCGRLTRAYYNEDVTVTLPESLDVDDILWLSVWCVDFQVPPLVLFTRAC